MPSPIDPRLLHVAFNPQGAKKSEDVYKPKEIVADEHYWKMVFKQFPQFKDFLQISESGPIDSKTHDAMYDYFEGVKFKATFRVIAGQSSPAGRKLNSAWRFYLGRYEAGQLPPVDTSEAKKTESEMVIESNIKESAPVEEDKNRTAVAAATETAQADTKKNNYALIVASAIVVLLIFSR